MSEEKRRSPRRYPPLLEKLIPILLGMILVGMIALVIIAVGVAMGWIG
jgi:hypothetical protein